MNEPEEIGIQRDSTQFARVVAVHDDGTVVAERIRNGKHFTVGAHWVARCGGLNVGDWIEQDRSSRVMRANLRVARV